MTRSLNSSFNSKPTTTVNGWMVVGNCGIVSVARILLQLTTSPKALCSARVHFAGIRGYLLTRGQIWAHPTHKYSCSHLWKDAAVIQILICCIAFPIKWDFWPPAELQARIVHRSSDCSGSVGLRPHPAANFICPSTREGRVEDGLSLNFSPGSGCNRKYLQNVHYMLNKNGMAWHGREKTAKGRAGKR